MQPSPKQVLLKHVRNRQRHDSSDYWHPSKMGLCDRRSVLYRAGVPESDLDDETLLKFWIGEVIHEALQKVLSEEMGDQVVGHEVAVRDEDNRVSGKIDSLIRTAIGEPVWEFKSIDSNSYRYSDLPKFAHIYQVLMYLVFGGYGRAKIAYFGKQDGRIEEYTVDLTPEIHDFIRADVRRLDGLLKDYREEGKLPPPLEAPKSDYRIRWCGYLGTGLCCGDPPNEPQADAGDPGTDEAQDDEPPGVPGLLRLGVLERETPGPHRRPRKSRKTEEARVA